MTDLDPRTDNDVDPAMARPARSKDCSLDRLTVELEAELEGVAPKDVDGAQVASLLRAYAAAEDSWRRYAIFGETSYGRNLIWRSRDFELLLLCWRSGQASAIHDHGDQNCWMAILDGALEEEHFSARDGQLKRGRVKVYDAGGVAFIRDEIALHQIRAGEAGDGVSLHLYSRPIDDCLSFCPESGESTPIRVGYTSVRGTPCGDADPDAIRAAWMG
ncbi:MAG: cysteine dioxygenase family protein [Planctomycetes bacterium]|nr:cysteine dioxygenase family protein [Planctomycetota bacterium]